MRNALNRPVVIGLIGAVIGVVIVAALSLLAPRGIGALVHAAPPVTDSSAPRTLPILPPSRGFDGQFYYRMAVSPFSTANRVAGVRFDIPALRQGRVGYPLLVWVASLGNRDHVPAALAAVNIAAMFALGFVGAALARAYGRHASFGLLFVVFPGFVYSLGFDLSEVVAAAFLAGAVLALERDRVAAAAVLASCALLTRETTAVFPIALVGAAVWSVATARPRRLQPEAKKLAIAGVVPLAVLAAWQLLVRWSWDAFPLSASADKNVRFPFQGLLDAIDKFLPPDSGAALFRDVSLAFLVLVIAVAGLAMRRSAAPAYVKISFVLAALILPLLSSFPWSGATSFVRAAMEMYFFAVLVIAGHDYRIRIHGVFAASVVGVFLLTLASEMQKART